jgi:hypothetical protein
VEPSRPTGVMPLRPLTFGELLDAAVSLLRTHARVFLGAAFLLAALEQAALYPLRQLAGITPPSYFPYADRLGAFWLTFATGLGTEAAILALLGGLTATAAGPALLGEHVPGRELLRRAGQRALPIIVIAAVAGILVGVGALAALIPWIFVYGLIGLAAPALIIDRVGPGRAIGRSFVLASRTGMRATWIRVGGYLSWLAIRLALGFGGGAGLRLVVPQTGEWLAITSVVTWLLVNTIAYATLACFDPVLYLETRMRTEGLDIAVGRTLRLGHPVDLAEPLRGLPAGRVP